MISTRAHHIRRAALPALLALAIVLSGCTSSDPDPTPPEGSTGGPDDPGAEDVPSDAEDVPSPAAGSLTELEAEPPLPAPRASSGSTATPAASAVLFVDGWTVATANTTSLTVTHPGGRQQQVRLTPVTDAEMSRLAEVNPRLVTDVAARLLDGDAALRCGPDGCTSDTRQLPLVTLTAPGTDEGGFGPVYDAYDVEHGLYWTRVPVSDGTSALRVSIGNAAHASLAVTPSSQPDPDADPEGTGVNPESRQGGYGRNEYLLGAAFGRTFVVEPAWVDEDGLSYYTRAAATQTALPKGNALPLLAGPSARSAPAAGLTDSQLTYWSSPTTGCGIGAICHPGQVTARSSTRASEDRRVCEDDIAVTLRLADATVEVDYPGFTHQRGLWSGATSDTVATGNGPHSGVPPLVEGTQRMRITTGTLYDGDGVLLDVVARVVHEGHGTVEDVTFDEVAERVLSVYTTCTPGTDVVVEDEQP